MNTLLEFLSTNINNPSYIESNDNDPSTWVVGDILYGITGYNMTLPRWYKIIKRTAKRITCIRLQGKIVSGHRNGQWEEIPSETKYDDDNHIATVTKNNIVKLAGVTLHLWDGKTPLDGDDMD